MSDPLAVYREAGRRGGLTTARYGSGYMRLIGRRGGAAGGRPRRRTWAEITNEPSPGARATAKTKTREGLRIIDRHE